MDDLISRQDAIDAIERLILPQVKGETAAEEINRVAWRCAINCAEEMIVHLPSAERNGHWIENETSYADHPTKQTCNCSVCKRASTRPLGDWCRWCGSRMDLDGDTE